MSHESRRFLALPERGHTLPFSDGVLAGDTLHIAGRIGIDPATGKPPADPDDEARFMLGDVRRVLELAGMTLGDVVSIHVFCSDISLFPRFNAVYREFFPGPDFPARAFLGSGPLLLGARYECVGVAVRR